MRIARIWEFFPEPSRRVYESKRTLGVRTASSGDSFARRASVYSCWE